MKGRLYPGLAGAVTDPNDEMFSFLDDYRILILAAGIVQKSNITFTTQAIQTIKVALTAAHSWTRLEQEELCGALFDLLFAVRTVGHVAQKATSANAKRQAAAKARLEKEAQSREADRIIIPIIAEEWRKNRKLRTANGLAGKCLDRVQEELQAGKKSGRELPSIGRDALRKRIHRYMKDGRLDSRPADNRTTEQSSS